MPCLCGDTACPSCGPAQGANPEADLIAEYLTERLPEIPEETFSLILDLIGKHEEARELIAEAARIEQEKLKGLTVQVHWVRPGPKELKRAIMSLQSLGLTFTRAENVCTVAQGFRSCSFRTGPGLSTEQVAAALGPIGIGFLFLERA